jgi:hypothetical protein
MYELLNDGERDYDAYILLSNLTLDDLSTIDKKDIPKRFFRYAGSNANGSVPRHFRLNEIVSIFRFTCSLNTILAIGNCCCRNQEATFEDSKSRTRR